VTVAGIVCGTPSCSAPILGGSLQTQLEVQLRRHISRYYEGWLVCDDAVCGRRTRMMRVYGRRCLSEGCKGVMGFEVSTCPHNRLKLKCGYYSTPIRSSITSFYTTRPSLTLRRFLARRKALLDMASRLRSGSAFLLQTIRWPLLTTSHRTHLCPGGTEYDYTRGT
jgi:DNA Polymerase alpha zinc finger